MARRLLIAGGGGSFPAPPNLRRQALFNGQNGDGVYGIGAGSSSDSGLTWSRFGSAPVIAHGTGWESDHVKDPWLMHVSGYVCYYSGYNGSAYQIGRATASSYTGTWTKYGSNPVIALGAGGSFNDAGCRFPTVLYEPTDTGKEWKLWFGADKSGAASSVGYAYSSDGVTFTVVGQVLTIGTGWEAQHIYPFATYKDGSTYYLFYGGQKNASAPVEWQGGYATFTDPEGTYTKGGGNPTLLAGFNTAGDSQSLTSDTASGSAVVHVTTTSHWFQGQAMVIAAGNVVTEERTIATIDSSTQVTLNAACSSTFATANGAVLRPFNFVSVVPRTVLATDTGYEMFYSPFQPVDDLTVTGNTLWEGSGRATSATLTGTWTYDESVGLLFPLSPGYAGWAKFSSENPSVIAAP